MEYRLNFFIKIFYGPAYVFVLFLLVQLAYLQTNNLVGWTKQEGILLFAVFNLMFSGCVLLFMQSVRFYLWEGFRRGELDSLLIKPAKLQFLVTVIRPEINQLPLTLGLLYLVIRQFLILNLSVLTLPFGLFLISFVLSFWAVYFFITTVMTLGFYVAKATQVIEFFDKITDYSQYPMPLFPSSLRAIFFTVIPIAFFGYIPVSVLLGKNNWVWVGNQLILVVILFIINQLAWKRALKHYSSASS